MSPLHASAVAGIGPLHFTERLLCGRAADPRAARHRSPPASADAPRREFREGTQGTAAARWATCDHCPAHPRAPCHRGDTSKKGTPRSLASLAQARWQTSPTSPPAPLRSLLSIPRDKIRATPTWSSQRAPEFGRCDPSHRTARPELARAEAGRRDPPSEYSCTDQAPHC